MMWQRHDVACDMSPTFTYVDAMLCIGSVTRKSPALHIDGCCNMLTDPNHGFVVPILVGQHPCSGGTSITGGAVSTRRISNWCEGGNRQILHSGYTRRCVREWPASSWTAGCRSSPPTCTTAHPSKSTTTAHSVSVP